VLDARDVVAKIGRELLRRRRMRRTEQVHLVVGELQVVRVPLTLEQRAQAGQQRCDRVRFAAVQRDRAPIIVIGHANLPPFPRTSRRTATARP
jgi:hypothetical protein